MKMINIKSIYLTSMLYLDYFIKELKTNIQKIENGLV